MVCSPHFVMAFLPTVLYRILPHCMLYLPAKTEGYCVHLRNEKPVIQYRRASNIYLLSAATGDPRRSQPSERHCLSKPAMDIRKFFSKKSASSGLQRPIGSSTNEASASDAIDVDADPPSNKAAAPSRASSRPSRAGKTRRSRKVVVDDDDDDDEEWKGNDVVAVADDGPEDDIDPVVPKAKAKSKAKAKAKTTPKSKAKTKEKTNAARTGNGSAGPAFGGGDLPDNGVAPPTKKRWVPRTDAPPNRGVKERPLGASDCFAGMVFVITGILDSLLREECVDMIKEHGGRVVSAPSKKVTHAVVGTEPGESKMKKLKNLKVTMIDEDGLFDIMRKSCPQKEEQEEEAEMEEEKDEPMVVEEVEEVKEVKSKSRRASGSAAKADGTQKMASKPKHDPNAKLWVDKYAPKDISELVANPKHLRDLGNWLRDWKDKFLRGDGHSRKLKYRGDTDFAAVLLVGPPGIGKTSAAHAVCRAEGFEPHEFNASDVRNRGGIAALADTVMVSASMTKFLKVSVNSNKETPYPNGQVLIMDEVDGMSGGDRGGSTELIKLIKTSRVPIICICNDDSSQKMRSLAGNCYKMKFRRPTAAQVTKRLLEIVRREGFRHVDDNTIQKLAEGCNGDIRQMINLLQTWRTESASLKYADVRDRLKSEGKTKVHKGIFELAMSFFKPGVDGATNSLNDRADNYFADSDLVPLFVQENYVSSMAAASSLSALADAAESIAEGDICNNIIRGQQRWDLMPTAAILTSIRPGTACAGGLTEQPRFPSFFGNLSKGTKFRRIVQELEMKIKAGGTSSGSVRAFRLDYVPALTTALATPLILGGAAGIDDVISRLDAYYLEKDPDWQDILETGVFPKGRGPLDCIAGPVKSALTREYKKREHARSAVTGVRFGASNRKSAAGADISKMAKNAGESGVVDADPESGDEDEETEKKDKGGDDAAEFAVKKPSRKRPAAGGAKAKAAPKRKRAKRS